MTNPPGLCWVQAPSVSQGCPAAGLGHWLFPGEHCFALQGTRGHGVPGTHRSSPLQPTVKSKQKENPELADCRFLSRVTQRAAGGRAGGLPKPCTATVPLQSSGAGLAQLGTAAGHKTMTSSTIHNSVCNTKINTWMLFPSLLHGKTWNQEIIPSFCN